MQPGCGVIKLARCIGGNGCAGSWSFSPRWPSLGRSVELARIDARQGDTGSFADPGIAVVLRRLKGRDGLLGLFAKVAQSDRGAPAQVAALLTREGLDQRRDDLCRVLLSLR